MTHMSIVNIWVKIKGIIMGQHWIRCQRNLRALKHVYSSNTHSCPTCLHSFLCTLYHRCGLRSWLSCLLFLLLFLWWTNRDTTMDKVMWGASVFIHQMTGWDYHTSYYRSVRALFLYKTSAPFIHDRCTSHRIPGIDCVQMFPVIWGRLCQNEVSRARTSNYIPQCLWDVITCPYPW